MAPFGEQYAGTINSAFTIAGRVLAGIAVAYSIQRMPRRPIDILHALVLGLLLLITLALAALGRLERWQASAAHYVLMLAIVFCVAQAVRRGWRGRFADVITSFYPLVIVPQVFNSLQPLITGIGLPNQDGTLIAIDQAMLGGHHATVWLERFVTPWLNDVMHLSYCTYYIFPLVVGVAMWRRSPEIARRFIFTAALAFYVSYIGYFLVPARGPRTAQAQLYTLSTRTTPISTGIYDFLDGAEKTKDDVFPSGHNMITAVCLIAAWRFNRRIFWWLLPVAVMLAISTVYCRFHYVIDVIAGIILAFLTLPAGYRMYDRATRGTGSSPDATSGGQA
ncbi:phosphatase PAP2 family protein [Humisphaera borealis]|uniref:Phosphatase PAP2 family protein n=1 Tax=Humisphaera borealis TaxID=2807512 RepID=A0A7M2WXY1_9BACT|nr:phosphatase PAP2 family protein [Humisphaera borealis]QOV89661.1 phosphatase PAP2 family protein [Humisphaera borealis]